MDFAPSVDQRKKNGQNYQRIIMDSAPPVDDQPKKADEETKEHLEYDHPIEEVRLTVSAYDDPSLPALTFRTWLIGLTSCILLSFSSKFIGYRSTQITLSPVCVQIAALPIGRFMAATLPTKKYRVPGTKWSFSFNPGPFNLKEHVLITILANSGAGGLYSMHIVTIVKAFYGRQMHPVAAMLLAQTTQLLGYGWAGLFRKYLVDSPYMWWPGNLVQVSLFRAFHDHDKRAKGGLTRLQFFLVVFVSSFAYYVIPGFLFTGISSISLACLIWKNSVTAHQIGSGLYGLGIGSFGLDWTSVSGFLGSPLSYPSFAIFNTLAGFFIVVYVLTPISYWNNWFDAKKFPFISSKTFDSTGAVYNTSRVIDDKTFTLDLNKYENYSKIYLSGFFAISYGLNFAQLMASITHVVLYNGKSIWRSWRKAVTAAKDKYEDVHTRIMKKNYAEVPQWWFYVILIITLVLSFWAVEGFGKQLQLPWWALILACAMALFFTLPIGVISATTNQQPGLNVITELVIGYLLPGKPLANVTFKTYGYISMSQAITLLADFKLGHYMKIPPRQMFWAQLVGTIVASTVYFATGWWLLNSVENICDMDKLPPDSPWTCPGDAVFYSASIIWGLVGPNRMFGKLGQYARLNWFFLFGALAPVPIWMLSKKYPEKKWLKHIHMPILIGATANMPPARSLDYIMWGIVGVYFNYYVYKKYKTWWARHTYVLSAGLDAGIAFMVVVSFCALGYQNINALDWWGTQGEDYCTLAKCPTAPGVVVHGCPVFS